MSIKRRLTKAIVRCDATCCHRKLTIKKGPFADISHDLHKKGWYTHRRNRHLCPYCKEDFFGIAERLRGYHKELLARVDNERF